MQPVYKISLLSGKDCRKPAAPKNGYISDPYDGADDSVKYACNEGYMLDGHTSNTCMDSETSHPHWSRPHPKCIGRFNKRCSIIVR